MYVCPISSIPQRTRTYCTYERKRVIFVFLIPLVWPVRNNKKTEAMKLYFPMTSYQVWWCMPLITEASRSL